MEHHPCQFFRHGKLIIFHMKSSFSRWSPVFLWAIVIFLASSNPDPYKPLPARWWIEPCFSVESSNPSCAELLGRFLHVSEYAVLTGLTARAIIWRSEISFASLFFILGLSELYALSDEFHQLLVPGRNFQLMDLALDLLGGVIGLIIFTFIRKYSQDRSKGIQLFAII